MNEYEKTINQIIKDYSNEKGVKENYNDLCKTLLPDDKELCEIIVFYLYGKRGSIKNAALSLFSKGDSSENFRQDKRRVFARLFHFLQNQNLLTGEKIHGNEPEIHHFKGNVESCMRKVKYIVDEQQDKSKIDDEKLTKFVNSWKKLFDDCNQRIQDISYYEIYTIIIDSFFIYDFNNYAMLYRLLCDIVSMQKKWNDDSTKRIEFLNILKQ